MSLMHGGPLVALFPTALLLACCAPAGKATPVSAPASEPTSALASPAAPAHAPASDGPEPAAVPVAAGWSVVPLADPEIAPALEKLRGAKSALAQQLMGALEGAIASGNPVAGIEACTSAAPAIAAQVSESHAVRIGRTSHRLRNPANQPPAFAAPAVVAIWAQETLYRGPSNELGYLAPIRVAAPCLTCHGAASAIPTPVQAALQETYPSDTAVGFAEGDLRGWFWVEGPAELWDGAAEGGSVL